MIVTPNVGEVDNLQKYLNEALTVKLYSNDLTPALGDTNASFTEVSGGGYSAVPLTFATWTIVGGTPTLAEYGSFVDFNFSGVTSGPGTIYGYYVVNASDVVKWAQRFAVVPFVPIDGSLVRLLLRYSLQNQS